jgi:DamX protein
VIETPRSTVENPAATLAPAQAAGNSAVPSAAKPEPVIPAAPVARAPAVSARQPPSASTKPVPAKATPAPARYSLAWLNTQAPSGYVLQLFGVRDRAAAVGFINSRKIEGNSAILTTQHEGAPWYVVVYGYYADRAAAQAAIAQLPRALGDLSPWARPLGSLK